MRKKKVERKTFELRVGTLSVGFMTRKEREQADMMKRRMDILGV